MNPRERIQAALRFEETDIVPYHLMIEDAVFPHLQDYLGTDFATQIDNHLPFYNLEPQKEWIEENRYVDSFGSIWKKAGAPHLESAPLNAPTLKGYSFPDLGSENLLDFADEFLAANADHFTFCGLAYGFFERAWALRGMENILMDFVDHPAFVDELFEGITEIQLPVIDRIAQYPFDGIRFADDWSSQRALLMGVARWRKTIKPGLARLFRRAREHGLTVMLHADGEFAEVIPDLIDMGLQILNPMQPEAMDIVKLKREYGKELCFNGGISTQLTLPFGSESEVKAEVEACLRYLGASGGYIAAPAKAIQPDVPMANAAVLIDALTNQTYSAKPRSMSADEILLKKVYAEFHTA
jgi:uroporphyrinogen decarboxylase